MRLLIDRKGRHVVSQLLSTDVGMTVEELSRTLGLSKRSVYYALKNINSELRRNNVDELRSVRNLGISLTPSARAVLLAYLADSRGSQPDYLSPSERKAIIVCTAFVEGEVTLDKLADLCSATKRTIQSDLISLNDHLRRYHVHIEAMGHQGMHLSGEEVDRRYVVLYYLDAAIALIEGGMLQVSWLEESASERSGLDTVARTLGVTYTEDLTTRLGIVMHYARDVEPSPRNVRIDVRNSPILDLVRMEFPEQSPAGQLYAATALMTHRLQDINPRLFDDTSTVNELGELANKVLNRYEDLSGVQYKNRPQLLRFLVQHMFYSRLSYECGVADINPLRDQVELEYPEIVAMTRLVLESLQEELPYPVTSGEIAYVSLLIGSNVLARRDDLVRVLVVCGSGISAAQMLRQELENISPFIRVVAVSSREQYATHANEVDLIVSSIQLDRDQRTVVVNPVMTDADKVRVRKALSRISMSIAEDVPMNSEVLFKRIRPFIREGSEDQVRAALARALGEVVLPARIRNPGLLDLIDPARIVLVDAGEVSWTDAIQRAGHPLVNDGSISPGYLDACIANIRTNGAYSMYPNEAYLAHAAPESGVRHLALSIAILRNGVVFPKAGKARFIVVLAPSDYRTHVRAITEVIEMFSDHTLVSSLLEANDEAQAYLTILGHKGAPRR